MAPRDLRHSIPSLLQLSLLPANTATCITAITTTATTSLAPNAPIFNDTSTTTTTTATTTAVVVALLLQDTLLLMLLLTRRWVAAYLSLGSVGWLWHSKVSSRVSPDSWSIAEYSGADKALVGWKARVCTGVGICGNAFGKHDDNVLNKNRGGKSSQKKGKDKEAEDSPGRVPGFVLEYAPFVHLYSEEIFLPGDIGEHLLHTTPHLNYTPITSRKAHPLLDNLNALNTYGRNVFLTSNDDPQSRPSWIRGDRNKPSDFTEETPEDERGMSAAPGIIIWADKGNNVTDAFYFYFYSFNLGNTVAGWRFGNHVGDWEHTAVRFVDGEPKSMFFSEHSGGAAYEYGAVEKIGVRPVCYSARGSHANYAAPGIHYYAIPFHLLSDITDKGPLWDVTKNFYAYNYDPISDVFAASDDTPLAPVEWLHYDGRWGDRFYPLNDARQYRVAGQYHYVSGPTGPRDKNLARREICQNEGICVVQPSLTLDLEGVRGGKWDSEDVWETSKDILIDGNADGEGEGGGEVRDEEREEMERELVGVREVRGEHGL